MSAGPCCPVRDTGLRPGPENVALDRVQLERAVAEPAAALLRFHRHRASASLGRHQRAADELRLDYCERQGIAVVRRVTGGGALYLDPEQLCWTLSFRRPPPLAGLGLADLVERLAHGIVAGLRELGVAARFASPNDIEVDGRKLASVYLAAVGEALLFQGGVLLDVDTAAVLKALRVPTEKLSPEGLRSARERLVTLKDCAPGVGLAALKGALLQGLEPAAGLRFIPAGPAARDPQAPAALDVMDDPGAAPSAEARPGWHAFLRTPGGVLRAAVRLDRTQERIAEAALSGGVQLAPLDLFPALGARLTGVPVSAVDAALDEFFARRPAELLGFSVADIRRVLRLALDRGEQQRALGLTPEQANGLMVLGGAQGLSAAAILGRATAMLVPYCAKPTWCKWRHRDGCVECGLCEVGEAYRQGRERGMKVVTVTHYEHLRATLAELRAQGVAAYVGMCCQSFFLKRQHAFHEAGLPAVLTDISGSNCYELQQEDLAYAGKFEAQARLQPEVVARVMRFVPPVRT